MKSIKTKPRTRYPETRTSLLCFCVFCSSLLLFMTCSPSLAVTSKVTRHATGADLLKGRTDNLVVSSEGSIQLGRAAQTLVEDFNDSVWAINALVVNGRTIFLGTSPDGAIYKYSLEKLIKIYPLKSHENENKKNTNADPNDPNKPKDPNVVQTDRYLANKHVFAMAADLAGRLLAGISGEKCSLLRFEADKLTEPQTLFEPNDAKYIFAITLDDAGDIYLATGPEGKVYKLNSFGKDPSVLYDSRDKNILSLVSRDGFIYAGGDDRGLVYKINPRDNTAAVLYDSDQPEITALLFARAGDLYAAATSAKITEKHPRPARELSMPGRPETQAQPLKTPDSAQNLLQLNIANTSQNDDDKAAQMQAAPPKPPKPTDASYIYKITKDGYVTNVFSETAVFFCLAAHQQKLLLGTGNTGKTFTIDLDSEQHALIHEDDQASQVTTIAVAQDDIYLGTANPPKLIKLAQTFAQEGTYTSDLIDAGQPAKWGKLQIEADIPQTCTVMLASRSGNVKDINDPTFSAWTDPAEVTGPVQLRCPPGRFCQYKLLLKSRDGKETPIVRAIAVASTVPNLAPKVESVSANRLAEPGKTGIFKIGYNAKDDNADKLIYKIDFRKIPRTNWIQVEDELEQDTFEWDTKTVEDGRYEIRVTASDRRANTPESALTASRISEPIVVDNTGPVIESVRINTAKNTVTLKLQVSDQLSAIGKVDYTVDSNADFITAMPEDLVYDTMQENFTIIIEQLDAGDHIIAVRVTDDVANTTYKTFEVNVTDN
ncbi:MAG: hypothetical protein ACYSTJ_05385 [Planctomycetota bacterium]